MNRKITMLLLLLLLTVLSVGCTLITPTMPVSAESVDADRARLETLSGTYASLATEEWYGAYGTRTFTFDEGRWALEFHFALDPEMTQKVFTFRTQGPYALQERSNVVPEAFHTIFYEEQKFVMVYLDDPALLAGMGMAACGLTAGVEQDISETGCANWKPVAECGEDHDLFAIDDQGQLYFGVRPQDNDMCTADRLPTEILPPVAKQ